MHSTVILIGVPPKGLPEGWESGLNVPNIGTVKPSPAAGFDSIYTDLIFTLVTGVTSQIIADWLTNKIRNSGVKTVRVNGKEVNIDQIDELQAEIDKAISGKNNP